MNKNILKAVSLCFMIVAIVSLSYFAYMQFEENESLSTEIEAIQEKVSKKENDIKSIKQNIEDLRIAQKSRREHEEQKKIMWEAEESFLDSLCAPDELTAVDLGLSVKWANKNIGASCPTAKGALCAWTDTMLNQKYSSWGYENVPIEATIDSLRHLIPRFDIATRVCGSKWRMPTKEEFEELISKCSIELDTIDFPFHEEYGYIVRFTGPSGMSIEMPLMSNKQIFDSYSSIFPKSYWTSTYNDHYVECDEGPCNHNGLEFCPFYFTYTREGEFGIDFDIDFGSPGTEMPIRPVCTK